MQIFSYFLLFFLINGHSAKNIPKRSTEVDAECGVPYGFTGFVFNNGTTATRYEFPWYVFCKEAASINNT